MCWNLAIMKVALVHDYLSQDGGAERVLKSLHEIWPEAPIFVLFHDRKKINYLNQEKIRESVLARMPFVRSAFQWYLPWMPAATESHDLRDFDVVISSTSAFSKGVITAPGTMHVSYCHTPPRYLWADAVDYVADLKCGPIIKKFLPNILHKLRVWDKVSIDRVDHFIANSETVKNRIQKYYRRNSDVIHPPIDTANFTVSEDVGDYYISGGRLVPYKRFDILVAAFNRLGWPLKIFGDGPERARLERFARPNIQFLGVITEDEKRRLLSRARAFLNPQIEDFGITAVESMAAGRPVVAYRHGGTTETVVEGQTGIFFDKQNWESLFDALLNFDTKIWNSEQIRAQAGRFDSTIFKDKMRQTVESRWADFQKQI